MTSSDGGVIAEDVRSDAPWIPGQLRSGFHLPGLAGIWGSEPVFGEPRVEAAPGGVVVGAAGFMLAGDVRGPARWDGTSWVALPPTEAYRIAVAADGTVYAVERPTACDLCGGAQVKRLVQGQWQPLPGEFYSVEELVATSMGVVIAADGDVQRFDGTAWIDLTGPYHGATVYAIAERDGVLCVGGRFAFIAGAAANNVACLGATGWAQAGAGLDGTVRALAFAGDGRLVAGGTFAIAGGANLAVLDQVGWTAFGGGVTGTDAVVKSIAVDGDSIIVGGRFDSPVTNLGRFSEGAWSSPTGAWLTAYSEAFVSDIAVGSDGIYFVGAFDRIGDTVATHIARWTSTGVEPVLAAGAVPLGIDGFVGVMLAEPDGSVIAGGEFVAAGTIAANNIARFSNGAWESLGSIGERVTALARTDTLYAGTSTGSVLRWSGTSWVSVASLNGGVNTMFAFGDELIVGGDFTMPDRIARWNGSTFERIGIAPLYRVLALGDIRGKLCAGVWVTGSGLGQPPDRPLWCWDGMYWRPEGLDGWSVHAITTLEDGTPVVAGSFLAGALAVDRGSGWAYVIINQNVQKIVQFRGGLLVGDGNYLRWWDGQTQDPLHEVAMGSIRALARAPQGVLVGGSGPLSRGDAPPDAFGVAAFDAN